MCKYRYCCNLPECVDKFTGNTFGCTTENYIVIKSAYYQEKTAYCNLCYGCCLGKEETSDDRTIRISKLCNGNQTCTITFDTGYWKIKITYDCVGRY